MNSAGSEFELLLSHLSRTHIFGKAKWRATTAQVQNNTIVKE